MANTSVSLMTVQQVSATLIDLATNAKAVLPDGSVVTWTPSDSTVVSVVAAPDGLTAAVTALKAGTATVNVVVKNNAGATIGQATGSITVTATGSGQLNLAIDFGTPSSKP